MEKMRVKCHPRSDSLKDPRGESSCNGSLRQCSWEKEAMELGKRGWGVAGGVGGGGGGKEAKKLCDFRQTVACLVTCVDDAALLRRPMGPAAPLS